MLKKNELLNKAKKMRMHPKMMKNVNNEGQIWKRRYIIYEAHIITDACGTLMNNNEKITYICNMYICYIPDSLLLLNSVYKAT